MGSHVVVVHNRGRNFSVFSFACPHTSRRSVGCMLVRAGAACGFATLDNRAAGELG